MIAGSRAGIPIQRPAYAQKDEFFARLDRVGSPTAAANHLGPNPSTCSNWISKLGLTKPVPRLVPGRKEEFLRLRSQGASMKGAAAGVGVSQKISRVWEHGMVWVGRKRGKYVYPDTLPVPYNRHLTTTFTEPATIPAGSADVTPQAIVERETVADMRSRSCSIRAIAWELERSPGTVSREIERNSRPTLGYMTHGAQRAAASRGASPQMPGTTAVASRYKRATHQQ